ncbi:hypothetical protein [Marispirochaeta sp.]|uniref:hypothetical protein n=1 Tax=Marispirochaeta sp. TaxID=2038653 RepID=UPI0029C855DD|nr:hypothetical protein [Marispirochaeta sp.]
MIRKLYTVVIICCILCGLASCGTGLISDMGRLDEDPKIASPGVESFSVPNLISVTWNEDEAADEYLLRRAAGENDPLNWVEVYRGSDLSWYDDGVANERLNLYQLYKIRGSVLFGPSESVLGVGSDICRDPHEPNNSIATATVLEADLESNLWYFVATNGKESRDFDWYAVTLPPRRQAVIVVTDNTNTSSTYNYMSWSTPSKSETDIVSGESFSIQNHEYEAAVVYFRVSPNEQTFLSQLSGYGGMVISYTVSLDQITNFNDE